MRKPRVHATIPPPPPAPDVRRRWPWRPLVAVAVLAASAVVAFALFSPDREEAAPEGMVWIPPGSFLFGSDEFDDAGPVHPVELSGFWMDATEVTNEQFAAFVEATGYRTVAERKPDLKDFPRWLSPEEQEKVKKAKP